jgi:hypothetical protein
MAARLPGVVAFGQRVFAHFATVGTGAIAAETR